jgi:hypothetical protein
MGLREPESFHFFLLAKGGSPARLRPHVFSESLMFFLKVKLKVQVQIQSQGHRRETDGFLRFRPGNGLTLRALI